MVVSPLSSKPIHKYVKVLPPEGTDVNVVSLVEQITVSIVAGLLDAKLLNTLGKP